MVPAAAVRTAGSADIADDAVVSTSIHAGGALRVGRRARVQAALSAAGDVDVGQDARLEGSLQVGGRLRWSAGASAAAVETTGTLVTGAGDVRASSVLARGGIHSVRPEGSA